MITGISSLRKKVEADLELLSKSYQDLNKILIEKFREEVSYSGSYEGLDLFNALNNIAMKNSISVKNACSLIKRQKDMSVFDIAEIEEEVVRGNLKKLVK